MGRVLILRGGRHAPDTRVTIPQLSSHEAIESGKMGNRAAVGHDQERRPQSRKGMMLDFRGT
jgi:hypothetical protein